MILEMLELLNEFAKIIEGRELAYLEKQGFFYVNRVGNRTELISIDGTTTLYPEQEENFPKVYILSNRKSLSELSRNVVGTWSEHSRNAIGTQSELAPEITEAQKKLAEKYNLTDFSTTLLGPQKQLASLTYRLILKSLEKADRQHKSKKRVIEEFYLPAQNAVEEKNFIELEEIKEEVLKYLGMQQRAIEARQVQRAEEKIWKKTKRRLFWLTGFIVLASLSLSAYLLSPAIQTPTVVNTNLQTKTWTPVEINEMIDSYEKEHKTEVYRWRRQKIVQELGGSNLTSGQMKDTLTYYIEKAWR